MREIKFRAWNKENKTMNVVKELSFVQHQDGRLDMIDAGWRNPIKTFELMQYTGVRDKNEKEIYEGDIVRWHEVLHTSRGIHDYGVSFGVVEFRTTNWSSEFEIKHVKGENRFYDEMGPRFSFDDVEVIGNIYENPELVK